MGFIPFKRDPQFRWTSDEELNNFLSDVNTSGNGPTNHEAARMESVRRAAGREGGFAGEQAMGAFMLDGGRSFNPAVVQSPYKPTSGGIASANAGLDSAAEPGAGGGGEGEASRWVAPFHAPYESWDSFYQGSPDMFLNNLNDSRKLGRQIQNYQQTSPILQQLQQMERGY